MLPSGVSRVSVEGQFYFPVDERYGSDGHVEDVAVDYNTDLDSSVFPALALVEAGFGMPAGSASVGRSVVDFKLDFTIVEFTFTRGVTDRLTLGVKVPWWRVRNNVHAELDATSATVGANAGLNTLAPLAVPGTVPLTTDDVQNLLGPGLTVGAAAIPGFGYDRVESWSDSGLADIEAGGRYQYLRSDDWRLAFTGAVRFPTGKVDNPDNLMDYSFGQGAYALLFHSNNDFTGWDRWLFDVTLLYEWVLPDHEVRRVPDDVNLPITTNKERVKRNLGDHYGVDVTANRTITEPLTVFARYRFKASGKDHVSGSQGFAYESLEEETDWREQVYHVGVTYSTVPRYARTRSGVPWAATVQYRNRFDGKNNVLKSQYVSAMAEVYF